MAEHWTDDDLRKPHWLEEYKRCGCTYVGPRDRLPGYCQRHFTDKRRRTKLPAGFVTSKDDLGYAGIG